jgi:uncharacterized protein YyaL (SSP411 family)
MLRGLADAYQAFGEPEFLNLALRNANFLQQHMRNQEAVYHNYKNDKATINGFLEDYALLIKAYIALYEITFAEDWLYEAKKLTDYVIRNFYDATEELFFFTDITSEKLIARKKEITDNVIPASNSVMATNLHFLGLCFDEPRFSQLSDSMLAKVKSLVVKEPSFMANWASVYFLKLKPTAEIALVGPKAEKYREELRRHFYPNTVVVGTTTESDLPLLQDREPIGDQTTIFVCYNKACQLPVYTVAEALSQLQQI